MGAPTSDRGGIQQVYRALVADGWEIVTVYDGGDDDEFVSSEKETIAAIMAVDDAYMNVVKGEQTGWVRFVLGNAPDEVVCDYTVNLSEVLDPLMRSWW